MDKRVEESLTSGAFALGVYDLREATRLVNFDRDPERRPRTFSRSTVARWLHGYEYDVGRERRHAAPLWQADYGSGDHVLQVSFRDLIELRFVKAFRDLGLGLPTIRKCLERAVDVIGNVRPFSTRR